jgi:hypothetical protein
MSLRPSELSVSETKLGGRWARELVLRGRWQLWAKRGNHFRLCNMLPGGEFGPEHQEACKFSHLTIDHAEIISALLVVVKLLFAIPA